PHRQGRMAPLYASWSQLRMCLIPLDTLNVYLLHDLLLMGLRTVGCHRLQPINGLESHRTDIGGALITETPPQTFQALFNSRCGEFATGHQGSPPGRRTPGRMPCSAAVRCVCACLSTPDAQCSLRRADCSTDTVDSDTKIE